MQKKEERKLLRKCPMDRQSGCGSARMMYARRTFVERVLLKTFQNRRVSSPAPVTMASPSGDMAYTHTHTRSDSSLVTF